MKTIKILLMLVQTLAMITFIAFRFSANMETEMYMIGLGVYAIVAILLILNLVFGLRTIKYPHNKGAATGFSIVSLIFNLVPAYLLFVFLKNPSIKGLAFAWVPMILLILFATYLYYSFKEANNSSVI